MTTFTAFTKLYLDDNLMSNASFKGHIALLAKTYITRDQVSKGTVTPKEFEAKSKLLVKDVFTKWRRLICHLQGLRL